MSPGGSLVSFGLFACLCRWSARVSGCFSCVSSGGSLLSFGHLFAVAGTVCAVLFSVSCC